ncbi:exosome non-catalytic core subunit rrp40 [Tieghemiomyces parasiticus]|uniref:Ribosomal RNA-processing protein 40 n=1 Tax=Tieghemiomyces parasiticus TaxID=78921 RepID=A0A9W8DSC2_9FUNG|nr:exosome non-catalytic core subunit rrp40 [Tieghemiomyces parasiticus]
MVKQQVVLPGEVVPMPDASQAKLLRLGPGLLQTDKDIHAVQAGLVTNNPVGNAWWISNSKKRYIPAAGEPVVGTVTGRSAEYYRIDIGSAYPAQLPVLAFEGATKRNRPNLAIGTVVYGYLASASRGMEPEMSCVNAKTGEADGYGELKGGFITKCSISLCQRLLDPRTPILALLAARLPLDVAIGLNGRVWVASKTIRGTILAGNAITNSEFLSPKQCETMVDQLCTTMKL